MARLSHTARILVRVLIPALGRDADQIQQFINAFPGVVTVHEIVKQDGLPNLITDPHHRIQGVHGALKDDGDLLPAIGAHLALAQGEQVRAVEDYPAGGDASVGGQEPHHRHECGGLAAARFADKPHSLPGRDVERDVLQGACDLAIRQDKLGGEMTHAQEWLFSHSRRAPHGAQPYSRRPPDGDLPGADSAFLPGRCRATRSRGSPTRWRGREEGRTTKHHW